MFGWASADRTLVARPNVSVFVASFRSSGYDIPLPRLENSQTHQLHWGNGATIRNGLLRAGRGGDHVQTHGSAHGGGAAKPPLIDRGGGPGFDQQYVAGAGA